MQMLIFYKNENDKTWKDYVKQVSSHVISESFWRPAMRTRVLNKLPTQDHSFQDTSTVKQLISITIFTL